MTIGLLLPISDRGAGTLLTPVRKPTVGTLDAVVNAISGIAGAALVSAGFEPASGELRIELLGSADSTAESRVRTALGGSEQPVKIEWVPA